MTIEGKITKHTYILSGGGEYVYYELNHNIILRMFIDEVVVILSPFLSKPWVLSDSTELVSFLDKFLLGVDEIFNAPPMVISEDTSNSLKFINELFKHNPFGLTRDDISFALREAGIRACNLDKYLKTLLANNIIYVTEGGRYRLVNEEVDE